DPRAVAAAGVLDGHRGAAPGEPRVDPRHLLGLDVDGRGPAAADGELGIVVELHHPGRRVAVGIVGARVHDEHRALQRCRRGIGPVVGTGAAATGASGASRSSGGSSRATTSAIVENATAAITATQPAPRERETSTGTRAETAICAVAATVTGASGMCPTAVG